MKLVGFFYNYSPLWVTFIRSIINDRFVSTPVIIVSDLNLTEAFYVQRNDYKPPIDRT